MIVRVITVRVMCDSESDDSESDDSGSGVCVSSSGSNLFFLLRFYVLSGLTSLVLQYFLCLSQL